MAVSDMHVCSYVAAQAMHVSVISESVSIIAITTLYLKCCPNARASRRDKGEVRGD